MASTEEFDPEWERRRMVGLIEGIYAQHIGKAAIYLTHYHGRPLTSHIVLAGIVEPFDGGDDEPLYQDMDAVLDIVTPFDRERRHAKVWFGADRLASMHYDLEYDAELQSIPRKAARLDAWTHHKLERVRFDPLLSQMKLQELMHSADDQVSPALERWLGSE